MLDLGGTDTPRLFVTDTLGDPYEQDETGTGIGRQLSRSRVAANKVKQQQPITVVIGNPPYKNAALGRGGWVENGSMARPRPILQDWQPPQEWGVGTDAKNLRNLYVYFWRWAAWKVFEQGGGGHDRTPPVDEKLSGLVCYITVAGFLNGPGFQKMRSELRRECDEIWVIDCSPEGLQPDVASRIFQGVQHPVCVVLASRSPDNNVAVPACVKFRALAAGDRTDKFEELAKLSLISSGWSDCALGWRDPFLPAWQEEWADFVAIDDLIADMGLGSMAGRTWVIAPDALTLADRWRDLTREYVSDEMEKDERARTRAELFHPHLRKGLPGDRHIGKPGKKLVGKQDTLEAIAELIEARRHPKTRGEAIEKLKIVSPVRYGFRSFDRQYIIPDSRLINQPSPNVWIAAGPKQVYLTALSRKSPRNGPAATLTADIPDHDHYNNRAGRVFALWEDAGATKTNVTDAAIATLTKQYGQAIDPLDIFAYVATLLANPAYTKAHQTDLIRPGLRLPLTADKTLFDKAAKLGRKVIWLHTFGERFADNRPPGEPRLPEERRPYVPAGGAIPATEADFPDTLDYDPTKLRLHVGKGHVDNVTPAMWAYEVSGKNVLRQWFSYRKKHRERPQIGDRREPSPLGQIQPDHWLSEYTSELLNVLNVLGLLIELEPGQADLLKQIEDGPLIPASKLKT